MYVILLIFSCSNRLPKRCNNKLSKKAIKACVPVHVFGHPARIDKIKAICDKYNIVVIEDAAESLGSKYKGKHS